jgi:hypothetical protein
VLAVVVVVAAFGIAGTEQGCVLLPKCESELEVAMTKGMMSPRVLGTMRKML